VGFFGDRATGEGPFHESLNISALLQLPVIWVCENNQYAGDTPIASGFAAHEATTGGIWRSNTLVPFTPPDQVLRPSGWP
jgi:TPP-dependent pyruvate/acetoin dehydrogenase alpha subunit